MKSGGFFDVSRMPSRCIVLLGAPGSGKGTAAAWLTGRLKVPHVSTGDILRAEMGADTELGRLAKSCGETGRLVPDRIITDLVEKWVDVHPRDGFLFDGFPRTLPQAEMFDEILKRHAIRLDAVLNLIVSRAIVEERILGRVVCAQCKAVYHQSRVPPRCEAICNVCGGALTRRADDEVGVFQERWRVYERETAGLVDFYRARGLVHDVDAAVDVGDLYDSVWKALTS